MKLAVSIWIVDKFPLSMIPLPAKVEFSKVYREEFCIAIRDGSHSISNQETVDLINLLCHSGIDVDNFSVNVEVGDTVYIIRIPEKFENILESYCKGEVILMKATIHKANGEEK